MPDLPVIYPVILSGGSGTRLWPLSRELRPKQLLPLAGELTMIQETARRVSGAGFGAPIVVCNEQHRFLIAEQLREIAVEPRAIVLEPMARNTAAAVAAAACCLGPDDADAMILVLPSDHVILARESFLAAVAVAARAGATGRLVTFGITPTAPETGYGYIHQGGALGGVAGAFELGRFVEKPDLATAQSYLAAGGWSWNSGMFLFPVRLLREEMARHAPAILAAAEKAVGLGARERDFLRLDAESFAASPATSIDYAVMEKTARAAVVPAALGWSDVGAWSALWEIGARDGAGNVILGDVLAEDTRASYLRSEGRLLATIGIENVVVVALKDAVLVAARDKVQNVKAIVDRIKAAKRGEASAPSRVPRPWGSYESLETGPGFQVKRIVVEPGQKISLQKHAKRAEHWVVVQGTARVTCGSDVRTLEPNMSAYIPVGAVHRMENVGREPLHVIEVQCGSYLGEDDIVRISDDFGRA